MDPVGQTSLFVAAVRARESERPDRLFNDPFARDLAGEIGLEALREGDSIGGASVPFLELRTRFGDDRIAAAADEGVRQFVFLAAGMDTRAYRLSWPRGSRVFELDRAEVLAYKSEKLAAAEPKCDLTRIDVDLRDDWPSTLVARGFQRDEKTMWSAEGLLVYLDANTVNTLLKQIDQLSVHGTKLICDVAGQSFLDAPFLKPHLERMRELGAPWVFGTDQPEALFEPLGWNALALEVGEFGSRFDRWPFPQAPRTVPGLPRSFFVEALKR